MRMICVQSGEDFGKVTRVTRWVSGRNKGSTQSVTTDRIMDVRIYPRHFVAFLNVSRGTYESKFVHGTFALVDDDEYPI